MPVLYRLALRENELDAKSKLLGYVLETFMNVGDWERGCRPSNEALVRGSGLSERSVRTGLRLLEQAELIATEQREGRASIYAPRLTAALLEPVYDFFERARVKRGQLTIAQALLTTATPAADAGVEARPRQEVPRPRQDMPGTPAGDAPEVELEVEQEVFPASLDEQAPPDGTETGFCKCSAPGCNHRGRGRWFGARAWCESHYRERAA